MSIVSATKKGHYFRNDPFLAESEENMPIRIAVNHLGSRITLSTGYRTDLKAWNADKEAVKQGHVNKQGEPYNIINANLFKRTMPIGRNK